MKIVRETSRSSKELANKSLVISSRAAENSAVTCYVIGVDNIMLRVDLTAGDVAKIVEAHQDV